MIPITVFSLPKAFQGHFDVIQRNATHSWVDAAKDGEVILFGDDAGVSAAANELQVKYGGRLTRNEYGTPLVSSLFARAQEIAVNEVLCFINADIILTPDLIPAVEAVARWHKPFLMVGQRRDVNLTTTLSGDPSARQTEIQKLKSGGILRSPVNIDCFVFTRGTYPEMPDFAIGRLCFDNWLIWNASSRGIPVVDMTPCVSLIHQNHDYGHAGNQEAIWRGPEARFAHAVMGHWSHYYTVAHATWMLNADREVVRARGMKYRIARPKRWLAHQLRFTRPARRAIRRAMARAKR